MTFMILFPYYPYDELVEKVSYMKQEMNIDELEEYKDISRKLDSRKRQYILMTLCLIFSIKTLYPFWLVARTVNHRDIDVNSSNIRFIDENTMQAFCIQTNCTKILLPGNDVSADVRQFPLIPLCYPNLNRLYMPTTFLTPYAILLHFLTANFVIIFGIILPLISMSSPAKCETVMFLVAPNLTRNLMCLSAKKIYDDYKTSLVNYMDKDMNQIEEIYCHRCIHFMQRPGDNHHLHYDFRSDIQRRSMADQINSTRSRKSGIAVRESSVGHDDERVHSCKGQDQFLQDCLPFIRTPMWHPRGQRLFVKTHAILTLIVILEYLITAADLINRSMIRMHELDRMRGYVYSSGCKAWLTNEEGVKDVLPPEILTVRWSMLILAENIIFPVVTSLGLCFLTLKYMINHELNSWVAEIEEKLEALIEVIRLQLSEDVDQEAKLNQHSPLQYKTLSELEVDNQVVKSLEIRSDGFGQRNLTGKLRTQQLVLKRLSETNLSPDQYLDQMVKLYISRRLLLNYIRHCSSAMPILSLGDYLSAFLTEAIAVWHGRLIGQFGSEHIMVTLLTSSWAIAFMVLLSNLHAKVCIHNWKPSRRL